MTAAILTGLAILLAVSACRSKKPIAYDATEATDLPREIAVQKLRELLPTAEYVVSTMPKDSLKPAEIQQIAVTDQEVVIMRAKDEPIRLAFIDVTQVTLSTYGKSATLARVFSRHQTKSNTAHLEFRWKAPETAQQCVDLFTALKGR